MSTILIFFGMLVGAILQDKFTIISLFTHDKPLEMREVTKDPKDLAYLANRLVEVLKDHYEE